MSSNYTAKSLVITAKYHVLKVNEDFRKCRDVISSWLGDNQCGDELQQLKRLIKPKKTAAVLRVSTATRRETEEGGGGEREKEMKIVRTAAAAAAVAAHFKIMQIKFMSTHGKLEGGGEICRHKKSLGKFVYLTASDVTFVMEQMLSSPPW